MEATSRVSPEPLLRQEPSRRQNRLAVLLGRAAARRGPSTVVRERAAMQLEERREDWGYSRPVVAIDMIWNLSFVLASVAVLVLTVRERPNVPIRVWIVGYGVQCLVHVGLVWAEYRRRRNGGGGEAGGSGSGSGLNESEEEEEEEEDRPARRSFRLFKRCESLNMMTSFVWWVIGFYCVVYGGEMLLQNAPRLYWLAVIFLAFDVFFAIFCVALACVIGIALCCCLPCIIAILYAVAGQEGASDADISILPRYKYEESSGSEQKPADGAGTMVPLECNNGDMVVNERKLLQEDAECCVCLTPYEDGAELHSLPCDHHFHSACIVKWLRINATCPLCKYNILKGSEQV